MLPTDPLTLAAPVLTGLALLTLGASFVQIRLNQRDLAKKRQEIEQRIYETLILREIGERIGYELNIEKILETIISSVNKLVTYSTVSYLLVSPDPDKVIYRINLDESVSRKFLDDTRSYLLQSLNQTAGRTYTNEALGEHLSGTIIDDGDQRKIGSLWLAPLKINDRGVGVLALASTKSGLYHGPEMEVLTKILAQANRTVNQLEEVITTEQAKILSMISSMADGVLMLDTDNSLVAINPPATKMLGLDKLVKVTILDVAKSLSDKLDLRAKIDEAIGQNDIVTFDNLIVGNGFYKLLISPAVDHNKKPIGSVVIFHDITAQKELERVRDEFTAMMVHELRAPLTVIRGTTDLFLSTPAMSGQKDGQELLATMKNSAQTMLELVNDLLDAAKIEAGKFQILKTHGDLRDLIRDRVTFFTQMAKPKQITVVTGDLPETLPAEYDRDRLSQVLNNLLSNAVKFTAVGGKITITAEKIAEATDIKWRFSRPDILPANVTGMKLPAILLSVNDTGGGIPRDQIGDLFAKFKQLARNTGEHKGTGLGLVIAKGIVESHGGTIFVESEVNSGTTFHITIPTS